MLQRLQLEKKLEVHHGCVNTVAWNRLIKLIDCNDDGGNDQQCASEFHQYCCFYCSFVFPKEWNSSPQWIGRSQAGHHGSIQFQVVIQNCLNFHVQKTETLFFSGSRKKFAPLTAQIFSQLNFFPRLRTIRLFPALVTERSSTRTYSDRRTPSTPSSTATEAPSTRSQSFLEIQTHSSPVERTELFDGLTSGRSRNVLKKIARRTS